MVVVVVWGMVWYPFVNRVFENSGKAEKRIGNAIRLRKKNQKSAHILKHQSLIIESAAGGKPDGRAGEGQKQSEAKRAKL